MADASKRRRKTPQALLAVRQIDVLRLRLERVREQLDDDWENLTDADKLEIAARLSGLPELTAAGAHLLAAATIRDERLRRARVQRRRRKKRRSGNSFQEILQAAARKCIAA